MLPLLLISVKHTDAAAKFGKEAKTHDKYLNDNLYTPIFKIADRNKLCLRVGRSDNVKQARLVLA